MYTRENREAMGEGTFKRTLGQLELVSLGIGGTIGSGIFVVPGIAAGIMGPESLGAWIIVAISATLVMISLAWAASKFGRKGTFFTIFSSVFGRKFSTVLVIFYTVSAILGVATIAAGIGQYISFFSIGNIIVIELLILSAFCIVNLIGISVSGLTENILTILKIVPLIVITLALLPFIRTQNFAVTVPFTFIGLFSTIIIVYWPFTGFEISAIPVEEMRDPKIVARSLVIVMIIVTSVYLLLNIALIGSTGIPILASSPAPVATAAAFLFPYAGYVVAVIGIFAMLSAMNAYIIASSRVLHTLAAEDYCPGPQPSEQQGDSCNRAGYLLRFHCGHAVLLERIQHSCHIIGDNDTRPLHFLLYRGVHHVPLDRAADRIGTRRSDVDGDSHPVLPLPLMRGPIGNQ